MAPRHHNIATETSKGLFRDQNTLTALAKLGGEEIVTTSGDSQWWSAHCLAGNPAEHRAGQ